MREDWRPLVFSVFCRCALDSLRGEVGGRLTFLFSSGVCWTGCKGRCVLDRPCALDRLRGEVGGRLSFLFSSGGCWTGYEERLQAACLVSFLQMCVGPAMREDWRPLVFSLFFRCALDRLRGEVGGRLSFLFSSGVCW
ncbi:hypothetical protein AB205_0139270, partial [Aquarana catesbeiana]